MNHLLKALDLEKSYGGRKVVDGLSLEVGRGEVVGLLGPNGAGKTTVFSIIAGLAAPDRGRVFLGEEDVSDLPMYLRARKGLGFLPQEASVFRGLTVRGNIQAVLEFKGAARRDPGLADRLLDEFGLEPLARSRAVDLSGGERRRLEIVRALAAEPRVLLLDEPFTGVDPLAVLELKKLIRGLRDRGLGILLTDHAVREALAVTDRAYIMESGRLLMSGTPEEVITSEAVRQSYLGREFRL
jgi:lipopolysaccharide export system ATP-binding protein